MIFIHLNSSISGEKSLYASDLINGFLVLSIYLAFDSFTSNWQEKIFSSWTVSSFAMMAAINGYSITLTTTSMVEQGDLSSTMSLLADSTALRRDLVILAGFGLIGQIFVFYTIREYGALIFTGIMMVRQFAAIALSSIIYHHDVNWFGVLIVFGGLVVLRMVKQGIIRLDAGKLFGKFAQKRSAHDILTRSVIAWNQISRHFSKLKSQRWSVSPTKFFWTLKSDYIDACIYKYSNTA